MEPGILNSVSPKLLEYKLRFENLPKIKAYRESDRFFATPFLVLKHK
eukprot:CAMPEP_0201285446 /NCGR_PEP_ID=MMETSP1317-20130820/108069_1 /ASSEMBLY_ACC=CAM_ASM_000770 /TAXON_ID=187299 /ORGANISM="Undescribed Undescribed, Strain Undescribed" /LENGTH=46 /DNA_ID= /DNA_START= /DNA_END= /DNA_ORIENTATION=